MVASIDMILTCDIKDCGNECLVSSDTDTVPVEGVLAYMRERATEPPRSWRVIDGSDVCYKHTGIPTEWEQWTTR